MTQPQANVQRIDPIWDRLKQEAQSCLKTEPMLAGLLQASILHHKSFESALKARIAGRLASADMPEHMLREVVEEAYQDDPAIVQSARADIAAVLERDPACHQLLQPLIYFKGYQAVQAYRIGHWLWTQGRKELAWFFQSKISTVFGVDIHPAAKIGDGLMIDHAHAIVIGETAVVGNNVSMLHSVTLGGTGKEDGDRHPKIEDGVLIGAGSKVLGNLRIGYCSRVAAGSVVLHDIEPCKTVAGVPAKVVGEAGCSQPSVSMNQLLANG